VIRNAAWLLLLAAGCAGLEESENHPAPAPLWNGIYKMKFSGRQGSRCRWVLDAAFGARRKLSRVAFHSRGKRPRAGSVTLARRGAVQVERTDLSPSTPAYVDYRWSVTSATRAFNTGFGLKASGRFELIIDDVGGCRDFGPIYIELRSAR